MPDTQKLHRRRRRLFAEQRGRCHWCGQPMLLIRRDWGKRQRPANLATIEHLISKLHPLRGKVPGKYALACYSCNHERGQREYAIHQRLAQGAVHA